MSPREALCKPFGKASRRPSTLNFPAVLVTYTKLWCFCKGLVDGHVNQCLAALVTRPIIEVYLQNRKFECYWEDWLMVPLQGRYPGYRVAKSPFMRLVGSKYHLSSAFPV